MRVVVWNMAGGYGYQASRHEAAWRYLADLEPDVALLQEAVPPAWATEHWAGVVAAEKYPNSAIPWGSAIVSSRGPLDPLEATPDHRWLGELWGGTVVARAPWLDGCWLVSIHSKAESRHPAELPPDRMDRVRLCHPAKVWEVELAAGDLEGLLAGERFIAGGDLNSSLLFDAVYGRETNVRQFANLLEAGFHDLRLPFRAEEQQTYFKSGRGPYQLDHVFSDAETLGKATAWRVLREPAADLALSDHAPIEVLIDEEASVQVAPRSSGGRGVPAPASAARAPRGGPARGSDALAPLVEAGVLVEGDALWLRKEAMARKRWHLYDPDDLAFTSSVALEGDGAVRLRWKAAVDAEAELVDPLDMTFRVYQTLADRMPDWNGKPFKPRAVLTCFTKGRDGPTLQELASDRGLVP